MNLEFPLYRTPPHEHAGKIVYLVMLVPFLVRLIVITGSHQMPSLAARALHG